MNSRARPNAFTLIELLVVIAVIAILIFLLATPIADSKKKSYATVCINNLKQITLGIHLYLEDQLNNSPGNTNVARSPFLNWTEYRKLIGDNVGVKTAPSPNDRVFACPADTFFYDMYGTSLSPSDGERAGVRGKRGFVHKPLHNQTNQVFTSYAYNAGMVTTRPTTNSDGTITPATTNFYGIAGMRLESIAHPARTVLIAEAPAYAPYLWHQPKKPFSEGNSKFNDSKNVVGFADGHVSYIKMYYDGKNFAWASNPPAKYEYQWTGD
jgi:prepilin-type N-terminal cleavage/methylation domain-containing protein/prepilin-type processing-associated H-X9-DG protein